ncbi:MAG: hypothetical protein EZS28_031120 [Streblomastix strix]|uniref:Uncharacterized protein n=1 Tax=Streblomastix strix TaxID=222440 RepID=A0A5J4UT00_9EUKA|nr:MAG: hypothetical protein EZS28_031119 [Streblomastix strix]KAA6373354.1 MAG: hypothetical protein EZS28_031120 [Streblomastix strix]
MLENIFCFHPTRDNHFATGILKINKDKLEYTFGDGTLSKLELFYKDVIAVSLTSKNSQEFNNLLTAAIGQAETNEDNSDEFRGKGNIGWFIDDDEDDENEDQDNEINEDKSSGQFDDPDLQNGFQ